MKKSGIEIEEENERMIQNKIERLKQEKEGIIEDQKEFKTIAIILFICSTLSLVCAVTRSFITFPNDFLYQKAAFLFVFGYQIRYIKELIKYLKNIRRSFKIDSELEDLNSRISNEKDNQKGLENFTSSYELNYSTKERSKPYLNNSNSVVKNLVIPPNFFDNFSEYSRLYKDNKLKKTLKKNSCSKEVIKAWMEYFKALGPQEEYQRGKVNTKKIVK